MINSLLMDKLKKSECPAAFIMRWLDTDAFAIGKYVSKDAEVAYYETYAICADGYVQWPELRMWRRLLADAVPIPPHHFELLKGLRDYRRCFLYWLKIDDIMQSVLLKPLEPAPDD